MNAYELADKLQMDKARALLYVDSVIESASILRQQADRIAELEKDNKKLHAIAQRMAMAESDARKSLQNIKDYKMNKPIGWYKEKSNDYFIDNIGQPDFQVEEFIEAGYIPLYTHPVRQLSDEEIETIMYKCDWSYDPVSFARAIIKASRGEE